MRAPTDLNQRRRRGRGPNRGRILLIIAAAVLLILFFSARGIAAFYTDWLWFRSLGYSQVFTGVIGARVALAVIFTVVFTILLWINLLVAERTAPAFRPHGPEDAFIERYQQLVARRVGTSERYSLSARKEIRPRKTVDTMGLVRMAMVKMLIIHHQDVVRFHNSVLVSPGENRRSSSAIALARISKP